MIKLKPDQVITLHKMLIDETGGLEGIRDYGLIDSAISAPFQTYGGEDLHLTIYEKAACLGFGLVNNHGFVDGNKRVGMLAMMAFLEVNNIAVNCIDEEIVKVGLALASGDMGQEELHEWVISHTK